MNTKLLLRTAFCCTAALIIGQANAQTGNGFVGIGTTTPKARLHINSDTSGILIPKYATLALVNSNCLPKLNSTDHKGLQVYVDETANRGFWFYNGTAFEKVGGSGGGSSSGSTVYGDGSAGALNITANTDWVTTPPSSYNFQFTTINVASGVTLTVPSGTKLRATGNVTISGTIAVSNPGNATIGGSPAPGIGRTPAVIDTSGIALGITKGQVMSLINIPANGGSGGGAAASGKSLPGMGGGSFAIYTSGSITVSGTVRSNGANAINIDASPATVNSAGSGGGGGGLIVLMSKTGITNSGSLSATGGNGGDGVLISGTTARAGGGGGGGGVVCLLAPAVSAGTVTLSGGSGGTTAGSGSSTAYTPGGGASGGNGGRSGAGGVLVAGAGQTGLQVTITATNPENLY